MANAKRYEDVWGGLGSMESRAILVGLEPGDFVGSMEKLDQFVQHCLDTGVMPPPNLVNGIARYVFRREEES